MDTGTVNLYTAHLESTPYGQVFQKIIRKDGFAKNIIENYNNEVINKIPQIILNTTIPTQKGIIQFRNVQMFKPTIEERSKVEDLYPRISHNKGIPYFATLKFEMVHKKLTGNVFGQPTYASEPDDVHVTEPLKCIPVMLGSELCHLNGKSAEEKMALGECFNDIFGYFISKSERVIINQENLRLSTFMIYVPDAVKGLIEGRITCPTTQGTTVTSITITKTKALAVSLQHLRKKPKKPILLPIFEVFKILGMDVQEAMDLILSFIPEQFREAATYILQSSISEYGNEISNGDDTVEALITNIYNRRLNDDKMVKRENIIRDIERDLFSNVKNVQNKLMHLAMYSSRMIEVLVESRKLDDRDSWANKRVATPGRSIYQLFKGIWANLINRTIAKTGDAKNLKDVVGKVNFTEIRDNFITAFGSAGWGVKGSYSKENIVDSLKRTTPLELYSQIGRLSTPTSRQSKNPVIRMPHGSQTGYFCLYETPDGEGVGLVKNFASSLFVSLERDPEPIVQILNSKELASYFTTERKHEELTPVTVNGVIEGWCVPEGLVISLKYYKSLGIINKDVCIFHNKRDRCVEIFCDGGRPTRPLFVVDRDNQLVIDKLNMWNSSIDDLIKAGCIEYLDAREQEWVYLAQDVNTVREFRENKIRMEKLSSKKTLSEEESVEFEILQLKFAQGVPEYTHCEIDPVAMFSLAANLVPQANRQAGPRTQYQANMSRQALTQYHSNEHLRFDAVYKMIYYPCKPIFQNDLQETAGLNLMPNGQTLQVAIMALPDNPEDGIVFKEEAIKYNNKFDLCKKSLTVSDISRSKDSTYEELFAKPPIKPGEPESRYSAIGDDGIPILDAYIRPGDCIIGKIRKFNKSTDTSVAGKVVNLSQFAGVGEEGYVDRVLITKTGNGDKIIKVKLRHNRKYIPGDKIACGHPDHEVLTSNRGWVKITQVDVNDKVATINPDTQILEYQNPTAIHHYSYTGPMYSIKGQQVEQLVTPGHRMYIKKRDKLSFEFDKVENVFGKRVNYKRNCINTLPDQEFFTIPEVTYKYNGIERTDPARNVPMDEWLTFFGIWIGDGCADESRVNIAAHKPRVQEVLNKIDPILNLNISRCKHNAWNINKGQLSMYFSKLSSGAINKHLPEWCFNLSERQSKILIEGLMLSDGHKAKAGGRYHYYTSSLYLCTDVQRLALHAGWSANVVKRSDAGYSAVKKDGEVITSNYDGYYISINRTKNEPQMNHGHSKTQNGQNEEIIHYEGSVHCLTVPNGIFYTRLNGIPSWTGNSRYSQKGTIAKVVSARYLPRVASGPLKGMVPDIFINPHGQPSRMTMNMMIEILVTKAALISGRYINSTTFREFNDEIKSAQKTLEDYGLDPNGKEEFELPNGKKLKNRIYFGPCFYQALKHHVTDKISMRARKGVKPSTRQPLGGRSLEGGLKVGEMERDALISHGASALLRERLCDVSDAFNLPICKRCGTIAITNHRLGIYKCNLCGDKAEIGLIRIPYVVKLLLFYLNAAGIHMTFKVNEIISPNGRPEEKFLM